MSNCKILIVDDEDFMRGAVLEVLRRENYVAMAASSAKEAIELITNQSFAVVITDVKMPGMDGITLFRELKKRHPDRISTRESNSKTLWRITQAP